jgi:uncharacterized protein (DUF302 family)
MSYYFSKITDLSFEEVLTKVADELKKEGFGILTEIDVRETLKKKLDVNFQKYKILGACNPPFAYEALQVENKIGMLLPCNVIVQELPDGNVEVAAIDPVQSMQVVGNPTLKVIAEQVQAKLRNVIRSYLKNGQPFALLPKGWPCQTLPTSSGLLRVNRYRVHPE